MGNQLVGVAPSQILPVEHYLTDQHNIYFDHSLGSTRFFKVARAKSQEGLIVVKVFAIQDPSLPLGIHRERLEYIRTHLASSFNCLPFQKIVLTDKAGLIMREYVKFSLYDRISTRPFLSILEKKWITFQILCALHQCHKVGICHGDIKLENIMLTSWNWVLLTDFASFKPTFLPEDNPADYSYFFDTSRRRLCYVAPERFVKTLGMDNMTKIMPGDDKLGGGLLLNESPCKAGDLLPSMDIFSTGCALLELWNDGTPAWDLSGLLVYRSSDTPHSVKLPKQCDKRLVDLLTSMTQRNPQARLSAEVYLDNERGKFFPEYFYSFLQSYMIFSAQPILPPDEKISRIHKDIASIISIFIKNPNDKRNYEEAIDIPIKSDDAETKFPYMIPRDFKFKTIDASKEIKINENNNETRITKDKKSISPDSEGLIIITSLVTSCIRGLHHCTSKLNCLDILYQLAEYASAETILDRIIPYIIHLTHDSLPRVRVSALNTLAKCLCMIDFLPKSDMNVFPEYIFPEIAPLATDSAVSVRAAYANNIALLAETALRFLDQTQNMENHKESAKVNYESELSALHEMVRQTVSSLLTDSQTLVRRVFMESGITKLCVFFGKQKANDVLLSHMITFLNDKEDTALRGSFFDCIVGVAAYVGWHCSHILVPLLQQGLTDPSEFIIAKSLRATTSLAELGLIQKPSLCELVAETVCYLTHPNLWIRHETCGLISCVATLLNPIDVNCKILPWVWPYLTYKLTQVDKPELLLGSLAQPIPRAIFDSVMKYKDINQFLQTLRKRREARLKVKQGTLPQYCEMSQTMKTLFRRLMSDGLTDQIESQILSMSTHLIEMQRTKTQSTSNQFSNESPGRLSISGISCISKMVTLENNVSDGSGDNHIQSGSKSLYTNSSVSSYKRQHKTSVSSQSAAENCSQMNYEWQHMFDNVDGVASSTLGPSTHNLTNQISAMPYGSGSGSSSQFTQRAASPNSLDSNATHLSLLVQERSYVQYSMAPCRQELKNLTTRQHIKYARALRSRECAMETCGINLPPPNWKPGTSLMAQLHEHRAAVNRLVNLSSGIHQNSSIAKGFFGSCSNDGTVRLWDLAKLEGISLVNRSKSMYNRGAGPVIGMAPCENNQSFAAATQDGSVFILRLDSASSRMVLSQCRQLDPTDDGGVIDVACNTQCSGGDNVIIYSTLYGGIVGWDLRAPGNAWKLQGDLKQGVYTCMYASGSGWLTIGTSSGRVCAWDLRFCLPITTLMHPKENRIRNIKAHPTEPCWIICAAGDEAGVWSLESAQRQAVLWPSNKPPLTYNSPCSHYINALYGGVVDDSPFILTAGTDQRVRFWDLDQPEDSYVLIGAPNDQYAPSNASVSYRSRLVDGTPVIQEVSTISSIPNTSTVSDEQASRYGPEPRGIHHTAPITDLNMVQANKCYLVSSSADGVINIWK
ncbi:vacuolar protein sorting 15 isoform X2 [Arctopsyche grandis]|uniref:vacuolar protein sorting 15 isoform X2 n=1 Tax=Arctopsyche grandis TaxID=121162 RepID=UPI00406D7639